MALIRDRDLLVIDASVFVDAFEVGTTLASGTDGSVSGSTFSSDAVNFQTAGVEEGHVACVNDAALEVLARPSANALTVTRPRASADGPTIPPAAGTGQKFTVTTFERQIAEAQAWALGALGIDPLDPVKPLDESAIVNVDEFARVLALRTIGDVYALAAARNPEDASLAARADLYRDRLRRAMNTTPMLLDLNGDGVADAARRLTTIALTRT